MQERDYIIAYQNGDFNAFAKLYEAYIDKIFAFVYRKTSDKEVAEDLCSQSWMKAMRSLKMIQVDERTNFKAWIYTIANNTVIDYYRTHKGEVDIDCICERGVSEDFAAQLDAKNTLKQISEYLWELKEIEKEIFTLRVWDDLSYKEIAWLLGKSQDACKKSFSRTLKKISAHIWILIVWIILFNMFVW